MALPYQLQTESGRAMLAIKQIAAHWQRDKETTKPSLRPGDSLVLPSCGGGHDGRCGRHWAWTPWPWRGRPGKAAAPASTRARRRTGGGRRGCPTRRPERSGWRRRAPARLAWLTCAAGRWGSSSHAPNGSPYPIHPLAFL